MNRINFLIYFITIVFSLESFALELNPYGKHFSGQGLEIEVALVKDKNKDGLNDALIKIAGAPAYDAQIDGKVFLHQAVHAGTGVNFKTSDGKVRMATRKAWGEWDFFEVYLNNKTFKVYPDDKKSKEIQVNELLKNLNK